ncbi:MAG: TetR/AcrR family transcriptional regulator [Endomicrobiaceae bacterium]
MTRPSHNIDLLLLEKGEELILEVGFEQFSIRGVCKKAGVNLGMFHYYFKTKEHFVKVLFEHLFGKHIVAQKEVILNHKKGIDKLKALLFLRARLGKRNKQLSFLFMKEIFTSGLSKIIEEHHKQEIKFLISLIKQCQDEGEISKKLSMSHIIPIIIAPVNFSVVFDMGMFKGVNQKNISDDKQDKNFEKYIKELIDIILRGLK